MALVLVGALGWALYAYVLQKDTDKAVVANVCNEELISEAYEPIANQDSEKLSGIAEKIKTQQNYDQDPNCLYILINNATSSSNFADAKTNLELYRQVYDAELGLLGDFAPVNGEPDIIAQQIEQYEARQKNIQDNTIFFNAET